MKEYNFNTYKLKKFFEWSTDATPLFYVHLSTEALKDSMGRQKRQFETLKIPEKPIKIEQKKEYSKPHFFDSYPEDIE